MKTLRRTAAALAVAALAGLAMAQATPLRPPQPAASDKPPLLTYFMVVVVGVLVIGGNLIPSKRGHQD